MIKLKELFIMESTEQLKSLPQGKLLINTINAHSYNTALKDPLFAEAVQTGRRAQIAKVWADISARVI